MTSVAFAVVMASQLAIATVTATRPAECCVCGGNGIPASDCNSECNQIDACGVRGGNGTDVDNDGICDDVDDCVGALDACGVCNG